MSKQAQSPALIGSGAHIQWTKPSLFGVDEQLEDAWCLSRRFDFPSSLLCPFLVGRLLVCLLHVGYSTVGRCWLQYKPGDPFHSVVCLSSFALESG